MAYHCAASEVLGEIVVKDSSVRGVKFFRLFLKHAPHQLESRLASVTYRGRSGGNRQEDWDVPEPLADLSELKFMRFIAQNVNAEHSVWREIVLNFGFHGPLRLDSLVASQGRFVTLGPFPSIERLLLTAPTDCSGTIQSHLDLSNNQQLRMLSLRGNWNFYDSLPPFAVNCRPALPSLTTLEFDLVSDTAVFSSFMQCIRLLGNAPTVHTLTVRSMSGITAPSSQMIQLDNLRRLRIVAAAGQLATIAYFLFRIKCPRLQQLVVQTVNDEGSNEPVTRFMLDIHDLLRRSECTLEVLKIQSRLISEERIIELLFQVPDLRSLVLSRCDDLSEKILFTLSVQCPGNRWCLDKLRRIVFDGCTFANENDYSEEDFADDMIEMMWSRLSTQVKSRKGLEVNVSDCGIEFDAEMYGQLEMMEGKGLKFGKEHLTSIAEFDDMDDV